MSGGGISNAYVVLGIPFGASRDVASKAFARRAKGLRHQPGGMERLTELTWALNQVTDVIRDPDAAVDVYRVPADPSALDPEGEGLFRPPPELMVRTTESAPLLHEDLRIRVARECVRFVASDVGDRMLLPSR